MPVPAWFFSFLLPLVLTCSLSSTHKSPNHLSLCIRDAKLSCIILPFKVRGVLRNAKESGDEIRPCSFVH